MNEQSKKYYNINFTTVPKFFTASIINLFTRFFRKLLSLSSFIVLLFTDFFNFSLSFSQSFCSSFFFSQKFWLKHKNLKLFNCYFISSSGKSFFPLLLRVLRLLKVTYLLSVNSSDCLN